MESKSQRLLWNAKIFCALLRKDLLVFRLGSLKRRLINNYAWVCLIIYIYQYVGLTGLVGYGAFIALGEVATRGFMSCNNDIIKIVHDLNGARSIEYYLTLPISSTLVLIELMVACTIRCIVLASLVLPVAKLILQDHFVITALGLSKFFLVFMCAYLFYGAFHLLFASFINTVDEFQNFRIRVADTLFWFGAYFFTWQKLYTQNKVVAYLDLLNPCVYACEGARAALLGPAGYLDWRLCCAMLLIFAVGVGTVALNRMKRKLDCV